MLTAESGFKFGKPDLSEEEILRLAFLVMAVLFISFSLLSLIRYRSHSPPGGVVWAYILAPPGQPEEFADSNHANATVFASVIRV